MQIAKSPKFLIIVIMLIIASMIIFGDPIILDKLFSNLENIYKLIELVTLAWLGKMGFRHINRKQSERDDNVDNGEN